MRHNDITAALERVLESWGCEITVQLNDEVWFIDPDGRTWKLETTFIDQPKDWDGQVTVPPPLSNQDIKHAAHKQDGEESKAAKGPGSFS